MKRIPGSLKLVRLGGSLDLKASGDEIPKRFTILAYTGGKLDVDGFSLPVVVDLAGLEASGEIPIAIKHNTSDATILGQTDADGIVNDGRQLILAGPVTADPADSPSVRRVLKMHKKGHKWQASIGAKVREKRMVTAGQVVVINGQRQVGPFIHATKSVLRETSVLGMGADKDTRVLLAHAKKGITQMNEFEKWLKACGLVSTKINSKLKAKLKKQYDLIRAMGSLHNGNTDENESDEESDTDSDEDDEIEEVEAEAELDVEAEANDDLEAEADLGDDEEEENEEEEEPRRPRRKQAVSRRRNRRESSVRANAEVDIAAQRKRRAREFRRVNTIEAEFSSDATLCAAAIEKGFTVEKTRQLFERRKRRQNVPFGHRRGASGQATLQALQGAMIIRAGGKIDHESYGGHMGMALDLPRWLRAGINEDVRQQAMEASWQFRDMSMVDLCRAALSIDGIDTPHSRTDMIRAAVSGGTLADIFTTNINAVLIGKLMEAGDSTLGWTKEAEAPNFQTMDRTKLTKGPNLTRHARGGSADHAKRSAETESYRINRYSQQFAVDEQDIIDDAFQAIADIPVEMSQAVSRMRPDLVYSILLGNPNLNATGRALFNLTEGNLKASGGGLSLANLKLAIAFMWAVQENGVNLNLQPTHLVVPPLLKFDADEFITSTTIVVTGDTDSVRGNSNKSINDLNLKVVTDGRLHNGVTDPVDDTVHAGSDTTWRLVSAQAKTIEVAYLRGTGGAPQIRQYILDKGSWGIGWDVNLDIGAKALGWRGFYESRA